MPEVPAPVSPRELFLLVVGLGASFVGLVAAADAFSLFGRHLWLDEVYTHALVSDPSAGHMMRALAGGVETHPPALYLVLRAFTSLTGTSDSALRAFAVLCVLAGLAGAYLTVRQTFSPFVAAAAVAVVGVHPLVLHNAFEARHYALWLSATAWLAWALGRYLTARNLGYGLVLAVASVLVCTTHYFGVVSLALVVGGALVLRPPSGSRLGALLPAAAGMVALLACAPLLVGQRRATTVPTWVPPPSASTLRSFLAGIMPLPYIVLTVLALVVLAAVVWKARRRGERATPGHAALVGLGCLLLLPALLIAFSYTAQPVLVDRYAIPTVLALAPLTAVLAARLPRPVTVVGITALAFLGGLFLHHRAAGYRDRDARFDELLADVRREADGPIAFERPHELFMLCHAAPDLAERCYLLDVADGQAPRARVFMRDLAARYAEFYDRPRVISREEFRSLPRRWLVGAALDDPSAGLHEVNRD